MDSIKQLKSVTGQFQKNMMAYLDKVDESLIAQTPLNEEVQQSLCDNVEKTVEQYAIIVDNSSKSLEKVDEAVKGIEKFKTASNVSHITGAVEVVKQAQQQVDTLERNLNNSHDNAERAVQKVVLLQEKPELSVELRSRLTGIVERYENTRKEGEQITGAVADVIQNLLGVIQDLESQKISLQKKMTEDSKQEQQAESDVNTPPVQKSMQEVDNAEYVEETADFDEDAEIIRDAASGKAKRNSKAKKGKGVSQAREIFGHTEEESEKQPTQYNDVYDNVSRVTVDFNVTPKLVKYVTEGNSYDRYTVMMRLTERLLRAATAYLAANGEELQKIAWDNHDHLYFNNYAFDFEMKNRGGLHDLEMAVEKDIQGYFNNNEWGKLFILSKKAIQKYCSTVNVLDFSSVEQYNEFVRVNIKMGIFGLNVSDIPKVCKKLQNRGMTSLSSIRLNGLDIAYHSNVYSEVADYDAQIANATTQEEYTTAYNNRARVAMQAPDMNVLNRAGNMRDALCTGINNVGGAKTLISKLWEKPLFRVPCKVFGYAKGVPLAFTVLAAMGPFAVVCGLFGLGVLGAAEWKKAKQTVGVADRQPVMGGNRANQVYAYNDCEYSDREYSDRDYDVDSRRKTSRRKGRKRSNSRV